MPANCRGARYLLPLTLAVLCLFTTLAHAHPDPVMNVVVRTRHGEAFVDVYFHVRATPQEVWAVITDYDHATEFISTLEKSVILSRTQNTLLVSQKGTKGWVLFLCRSRR